MARKKQIRTAYIHGAILGAILAVSLSLPSFFETKASLIEPEKEELVVDVGIEHTEPLELHIDSTTLEDIGMIEFSHSSSETIFISMPSDWTRREVRNASLSDVTPTDTGLGYTRWSLPPRAKASFRVPVIADNVIFHNPSGIRVLINLTRVDLGTETADREVFVLQD